ncbi:MAG TPA: SH3 domain-containing protein [Anaerolineae bacterium]|nr:SH3 domain-containing protein [Anaerolineae bacterium]
MSKLFLVPLGLLIALAAACGGSGTPSKAPPIVVVTATSPANPAIIPTTTANVPAPASATPAESDASETTHAETPDPTLKPTSVKYVRAKEDINVRNGPGTSFKIVGGVYAGNTAEVTGYQSADGQWWRVVCPVTTETFCWVSADPTLTEPATEPNFGPTVTKSAEATAETFVRNLGEAIQNKDYDALREMMDDSFAVGYWRSEGTKPTTAEAISLLQTTWLGPSNQIVVDVADKTDQTKLLGGTSPLSMWDPQVKVVKSVFAKGLGASGKDEAMLILAQRADGSLYWYGILYAANGFQ